VDYSPDRYVQGYLLTFDLDKYLLIDKGQDPKREFPAELKWTGIGGKIKHIPPLDNIGIGSMENPHEAMVREFKEETGYEIKIHRWFCFLIKEYQGIKIYMFVSFCSPDEMTKISRIFPKQIGPEGKVSIHNTIDIFFDPDLYTFDMPYLMNMIVREARRGFLPKLDPEGINSAQRARNSH